MEGDYTLRDAVQQYDPSAERTDGPFDRWQRADLVEELIANMRKISPEYVEDTLEMAAKLESEVVKIAPVRRLRDIMMLDRAPVNAEQKQTVHNRFQHSELLSHLSMTIGMRLQLPPQDVLAMMLAGWLHDSGHVGFAHAGEDALNEIFPDEPRVDHEKIAHTHVESGAVQKICLDLGIDSQKVKGIIDEKGALGTLQSACDTLSYLLLDVAETGREELLTSADAQRILQTIQGVQEYDGEQMLVVSDTQPWQHMLDVRAMMYREVYHSFEARIPDKALSRLLAHAVDKNLIDAATVIKEHDRELVLKLHSFIYGPTSLQDPVLSKDGPLFDLAMGRYPNAAWSETRYDTIEEAQAHIQHPDLAIIEPTTIAARKKELKLIVAGSSTPITLTAQAHHDTESVGWVLLEPISV